LGGTKIEAVVVDGASKVLGSARRPTPTAAGPQDVADAMVAAMEDACSLAGAKPSALVGIGVGAPGAIDEKTGTVAEAPNLPGLSGTYPLGATLSKRLGAKVLVGNDVQVATEAEFTLGAGKPYRSLLGVFWGTGVGGGIVLNGTSWIGRGGAGEIGHTVVKVGGRRCPCGRRGCMEAYAGRAAMEARARELQRRGAKTDLFKLMKRHDQTRLTSSIWGRALEQSDKLATQLIDEAIVALGAGIGSAVNLLDVEAVVVGGGLGVRFGQPYVDRIEKAMLPHVFKASSPPAVHLAALGDTGGAIGAALLVKRTGAR
jgi:glucokinase